MYGYSLNIQINTNYGIYSGNKLDKISKMSPDSCNSKRRNYEDIKDIKKAFILLEILAKQ